jgi:cytochrome c-type biogenesis protein
MSLDPVGFASFAFVAGASAFFAPCSYPLLPGYLAYFLGEHADDGRPRTARLWRAAVVGLHVIVGFALVFAALGAVVAVAGTRALGDAILLEPVVGSLLVVLGARMALGKPVAVGGGLRLPERRRRATAYVLFGVVYAAAAAGCTAPLFLAVAGVSVREGPATAALGVGSYAAGMSALLVAVTVLSAFGRDALLARLSANAGRITRGAGVLLVLAGIAQLYLFVFRYDGLRLLGLA